MRVAHTTRLLLAASVVLSLVGLRSVGAQRPASGSLTGVVSDSASHEPLAGAVVIVLGTQFRAVTGSNGRYRITALDSGGHAVRVVAIGYRSEIRRAVTIPPGATQQLDWALVHAPVQLSAMAVTASRTEEQSGDAPASVSVMTGERLVDLGATRVDQALGYIQTTCPFAARRASPRGSAAMSS